MSNYSQTTFFTPKDSLPITDPNKTIFGAAYDVEFANISSAIATKIDSTFNNPSVQSINITSNAVPANGLGLPSAGTLGIYAGSTLAISVAAGGVTFNVPVSGFSLTGLATVGGINVNGSTVPANGIYLPSANTLGFAANTTAVGTWATGGMVIGTATGGAQGAGTVNAQGLYINGVALSTASGAVVGSGTAALSAASIAIGQTYIVWRSAASASRNNSASADSVLQITGLPVGTYSFSAQVFFASTSSNTQSVAWSMGPVGTGTINSSTYTTAVEGSTTLTNQGLLNTTQTFSSAGANNSTAASVSANYSLQTNMTGIFTVSVGTVGPTVFWQGGAAQAYQMTAGSTISVTRLA